MKTFGLYLIGILVILGGLAFGMFMGYVSIWHCFVMSVVDFINQCKAPTVDAFAIAYDLFCFFVGGSIAGTVAFWGAVIIMGIGSSLIAMGRQNAIRKIRLQKQMEIFDKVIPNKFKLLNESANRNN